MVSERGDGARLNYGMQTPCFQRVKTLTHSRAVTDTAAARSEHPLANVNPWASSSPAMVAAGLACLPAWPALAVAAAVG